MQRRKTAMWIQFTTTHEDGRYVLRGLKRPWMDEPIEVNQNGRANVPQRVGERLIDNRSDVEPTADTNDADDTVGESSDDDSDDESSGDSGED